MPSSINPKDLEKALKKIKGDFHLKANKFALEIFPDGKGKGKTKATEIPLENKIQGAMEVVLHSSSLIQAILKIAATEKVAVLLPVTAATVGLQWATTTLILSGTIIQAIKAVKALSPDEEEKPNKPNLKALPGGKAEEVPVDIDGTRLEPPKNEAEAKEITKKAKTTAKHLKNKAKEEKSSAKAAELEAKADQLEAQAKQLESFKSEDLLGGIIELFWTENRVMRLTFYKHPAWDFKFEIAEREFDPNLEA